MEFNSYTENVSSDNLMETDSIETITFSFKAVETLINVKMYMHFHINMTFTNYCTHLSGYIYKSSVWFHTHKSIFSNLGKAN